MKERIQKIIASSGVASRRRAEELIRAGRVTCNGIVVQLGNTADFEVDEILLDGQPLPSNGEKLYIMLNKPRGYVTTLSDERGRKNVAQLVEDCGVRVYPVGRLDMDSEGLLLLTNDGEFANRLMHPKHEIRKTYHVAVKGFTQAGFDRLNRPIVLDGYRIKAPTVRVLDKPADDKAILEIVIHEGRNRQIRRMCAAAGMQVSRLCRVAEGTVVLGALPAGHWRHLTPEEIVALKG